MNANHKIAGAPISWGVCEVPGWGYQLGLDRVLTEMREIGLLATELGPDGFLPAEPVAMADVLSEHGLRAIGEFTPAAVACAGARSVRRLRILDGYAASGATVLVLSADSGLTGYDTPPSLITTDGKPCCPTWIALRSRPRLGKFALCCIPTSAP